jgi:hypothetical protein
MFVVSKNVVYAAEYLSFQEINFEHDGMRFLDDYTQNMYDKYYEKVSKRKFWGWRTYTTYKTEPVNYTKETLYKIHNEGTTAITQTFNFETGKTTKKQFNVSGSIGLEGKGTVKGFKLGLEQKLDNAITAVMTDQYDEEINIKVNVDPNTRLLVQIKGEGQVSNGVAAYYVFWHPIHLGGWEVFVVTTEYYSIVKEVIES